ncbi:MAG: hypothetical protein V7717_04545 [Porticoccaceae bacterium]
MSMQKLSPDAIDLAKNELRRSVEKAVGLARNLSADNADELNAVIRDVWGAAVVCQLEGISRLMDEVSDVLEQFKANTLTLAVIAVPIQDALHATLGLLGYLVKKRVDNPCLLIPELSALRAIQKKPPFYEYHLLPRVQWPGFHLSQDTLANAAPDATLLKRITQFYQMGLVHILKDTNREKGFQIISDAAGRLVRIGLSPQEKNYWAVFKAMVDSMADGGLTLRLDRVRLLAVVEKQLRGIVNSKSDQPGSNLYPEGLWRAFLVLVAMNPDPKKRKNAKHEFGAPVLEFTDADLSSIREQMLGKGDDKRSPFNVLQKMVASIRSALDLAQEEDRQLPKEVMSTIQHDFATVSDHCQILGLTSIADKFRRHSEELAVQIEAGKELETEQVVEFTNSVLYLESAVAEFWGALPTRAELTDWDAQPFDVIIQNGQLKTARHAVLQGATDALVGVKEMLEEMKKNVARADIMNELDRAFTDLRACAVILDMKRFSKLIEGARIFALERNNINGSGATKLDSFADMLVSLEFYLDACKMDDAGNQRPLNIAEECLAAIAA